jgi:hypothetical protein
LFFAILPHANLLLLSEKAKNKHTSRRNQFQSSVSVSTHLLFNRGVTSFRIALPSTRLLKCEAMYRSKSDSRFFILFFYYRLTILHGKILRVGGVENACVCANPLDFAVEVYLSHPHSPPV